MYFSASLALLGLGSLQGALAQPNVVLENNTDSIPHGWRQIGPAKDNEIISLAIALKQPRVSDLEQHLLQKRGSHLSKSQLLPYIQPPENASADVISWLQKNDIDDIEQNIAWVTLNTTVRKARSLLDADVSIFAFEDNPPVLRAPSYSIPASLEDHVDLVHPLANFRPALDERLTPNKQITLQRRMAAGSQGSEIEACENILGATQGGLSLCTEDEVTPFILKTIYNWSLKSTKALKSSVRFAVAGFLEQFVNYKDIDEFLQEEIPTLRRRTPSYNFTVDLVNGGLNTLESPYHAGVEGSLDMEYAMALGYPSKISYISVGGRGNTVGADGKINKKNKGDNEPYLELLEYLIGLPDSKIPHVLSISYSDDEQSVPQRYAKKVCNLIMQLTSRGTTVLVATGDGGSQGIGRNYCVRNDGSNQRSMLATFPSTCPWVTAVGATEGANPPRAAPYSSGGFSNYFRRPDWQDEEVEGYLAKLKKGKSGLFNPHGRGFPDISIIGTNFRILWDGTWTTASGTSCSTPVIAAMIAEINEARLRAKKPVLGWLNPILYSENFGEKVLQDVVKGQSFKCPFNSRDSVSGWPAKKGWDAVTGQGIPYDFELFKDALLKAD